MHSCPSTGRRASRGDTRPPDGPGSRAERMRRILTLPPLSLKGGRLGGSFDHCRCRRAGGRIGIRTSSRCHLAAHVTRAGIGEQTRLPPRPVRPASFYAGSECPTRELPRRSDQDLVTRSRYHKRPHSSAGNYGAGGESVSIGASSSTNSASTLSRAASVVAFIHR